MPSRSGKVFGVILFPLGSLFNEACGPFGRRLGPMADIPPQRPFPSPFPGLRVGTQLDPTKRLLFQWSPFPPPQSPRHLKDSPARERLLGTCPEGLPGLFDPPLPASPRCIASPLSHCKAARRPLFEVTSKLRNRSRGQRPPGSASPLWHGLPQVLFLAKPPSYSRLWFYYSML